ncbi:hypothetical protein KEM56_001476 [Ascosphaera pollenicola]|nr:hypothetical protein KEM56_001476 [Ascosphaera pollenicola]
MDGVASGESTSMNASLSDIPVALLRAELLRRSDDVGGFDIRDETGAAHVHGTEYDTLCVSNENEETLRERQSGDGHNHSSEDYEDGYLRPPGVYHDSSTDNLLDNTSPLLAPKFASTPPDSDGPDMTLEELEAHPEQGHVLHNHHRHQSHSHSLNETIDSPQAAQKQLLQCLLLEAGILFHSIFIGMALSVETGAPFIVLLVAIAFHQTFEGFALGARIAALIPALFPASSPRPWLMALAYGATTPIGQAIGLLVHNLYDPQSTTGLLMVGLTNAFSSGLLLFAGLVELLAEDFLSDRSYEVLQGKSRIQACLAVFLGAMLMAFVGAFA